MTAQTAPNVDIDHLRSWIGKTEEARDVVTQRLAETLRVTLFMEAGVQKLGDVAPLTMHWCLAPALVTAAQIGEDGHAKRGDFLPPVPLPRRMWASAKTETVEPLRVGDEVTRHSKIADVALKNGNTGQLCFVTVEHVISSPRGVAIRERQDVVYRDAPHADGNKTPAPPKDAAPKGDHQRALVADPVLLFRYSAVTFNPHRIHYDRTYVTGVEGYPGLVVQGSLQAALLMEYGASLRGGRPPKIFTHRGVSPLFDGPFTLNAKEGDSGLQLWTANGAGTPAVEASASW